MNVLERIKKQCGACLQEHEVQTISLEETTTFKHVEVSFSSVYEYCENTDILSEDEALLRTNDLSMKNAYRTKMGLLKADEITGIRGKYSISQKELSELLGWGQATIGRYESHQVQDKAHDKLLRIIDEDPQKYLELLEAGRNLISKRTYDKSFSAATKLFANSGDQYLRSSIESEYAAIVDGIYSGYRELNLNKVVDMINYYAIKAQPLYSVKLAKMLWYGDKYHFDNQGHAISGLLYHAMPKGAVPRSYWKIINLEGIKSEEVVICDNLSVRFIPKKDHSFKNLTEDEITSLNHVIENYGVYNSSNISEVMHCEDVYKITQPNGLIPFAINSK